MPILHCVITGRVQGVGFRMFCEDAAWSLGLSGWARNLRSGAVETEVEGPREDLHEYLARMRRGPALARVSSVNERWEEDEGRHDGFTILPTG